MTTGAGSSNIATAVNTRSRLVTIEGLDVAADVLKDGLATGAVSLSIPSDVAVPTVATESVVGDPAKRTGFAAFEAIEITMIVAPDLMSAHRQGLIDTEGVVAVQTAMVSHCELMGNRMAILDTPAGLNAQQASEWRETTNFDSSSRFSTGRGFRCSIRPSDTTSTSTERTPVGSVEPQRRARGVFKAPANEVIQGATGLELAVTRGEMDMLSPMGVNSIKSFPGRGIRVWGGRTLSSDASGVT